MLTSQCGANMATPQPDKVSQLFVHILVQGFHFTYIYIPFILRLFNYMQNNDDL